jgi:flagellar basal body-associated protein FliL
LFVVNEFTKGGEMKKTLLWIVVLVISISMVIGFSLSGCKKEAAPAEEAPAR